MWEAGDCRRDFAPWIQGCLREMKEAMSVVVVMVKKGYLKR
jgi:hypothetical protein